MFRLLLTLLLVCSLQSAYAAEVELQATNAPALASPAVTTALPHGAAHEPMAFDIDGATQEFMNRLQGEARAKFDAYAEGGYWLSVWNLLLGLAIAWLLLTQRISARMRDFAVSRTASKNGQVLIYVLYYLLLVSLLSFPLVLYAEFYREHQYGLSNMTLLAWLGEQGIALAVNALLMGIAFTGLYTIFRRIPKTWWVWGSVSGKYSVNP